MGVLTENDIRDFIKKRNLKTINEMEVEDNVIVTPSARAFLIENNISLKPKSKAQAENERQSDYSIKEQKVELPNTPPEDKRILPKYVTETGAYLESKPEYMTGLYGNLLVFKDHKRIIYRGKVDALESSIIRAQIDIDKLGLPKLVGELQEVLDFVRNLMHCEVLNEEVGEFLLIGLGPEQLREMSHFPKKYFGIGHFFPDYKMGEAVAILNSLRSSIREVELSAYAAFKTVNGKTERDDIIRALNRLSSLMWIMMFRYLKGEYKQT